MTAFQKVEALLPEFTPGEKAMLIQKVSAQSPDLFPGIEKTPGVCGGSACIIRTRIPVWSLVNLKKLGFSDPELLQNYPSLRQQDLDNAWNYYILHDKEIDSEIRENEEA
ncbi:MAG TPA: DUF433 domain-containing protein [Haliscomenobacter sp.]|uniref:DUF433 domain-containing protein n=1 Tax=Haliscomenobacter sp. TaxID=2717303 RepID=UPI002C3D3869|nr:DUF433 domain-containing protein [Haliscomenobacter sp.]HOY16854.1 DUF433 domain-containing protein [Haliscomenobacter sp.]HPH17532.1 DUF433 domain-containing protein [Haliscomenobacter sp.]